MRVGWRRLVLACLVAVSAIVVMVPGGSAGNRTAEVFFDAVPGPGAVTYGENIAYRATFTNTSGSTYTHVMLRMRVPYVDASGSQPYVEASFVDSTCPVNDGLGVTVPLSTGGSEWQCDFGTVAAGTAGTPQIILSVVWKAPTLTLAGDCPRCLKTNGRFTAKEGTNDVSDPNDAFYPPGGGPDVLTLATLLSAESTTLNSTDTTMAGGYEIEACTNPLGAGSLRTKPTLHASLNPVSTTVCIPSIPSNATDLGLATTIVEGPLQAGNPGHAVLGRSDVCVAALGANCGRFGEYPPQPFGTANPLTLVFRIADAALTNGDKITQVWHNGTLLNTCLADPNNANGCLVSIDRSGGPVKTSTVIVKSPTNGWYTW